MMTDVRSKQNRVKRSMYYVERDCALLQPASACYSPKSYLGGGR